MTQPTHRRAVGFGLSAGVGACFAVMAIRLPRHSPLPAIARQALVESLPRWHTTEPVNAIVYGFRGFDTFGETFILLGAVVGVLVVCRGREHRSAYLEEDRIAAEEQAATRATWRIGPNPTAAQPEAAERSDAGETAPQRIGVPGPEPSRLMTSVIRGGARTALPILAVAGIYLAAWGFSPGGGFPAGAVIAGVVVVVYAGWGYRYVRRVVRPDVLEPLELGGAALIIGLGVLGLVVKGSVSASWLPLGQAKTIAGGGVLQAFSGAELIEVATGLLLVIFNLLAMGREWTNDGENGGDGEKGAGT